MGNDHDICDSLDKNKMTISEHQQGLHSCNSDKENSQVILHKCDNGTCGKSLIPPYYISLTIPSNPYQRFTRECSSNFVLISRLLQSNQAEVLINANG